MGEKKEMKWIEIFSQGDIWELEKVGNKLLGFRTENDADAYKEDELCDNGISTVEQRAKDMGLIFSEINFRGEEIENIPDAKLCLKELKEYTGNNPWQDIILGYDIDKEKQHKKDAEGSSSVYFEDGSLLLLTSDGWEAFDDQDE